MLRFVHRNGSKWNEILSWDLNLARITERERESGLRLRGRRKKMYNF